MGVVVEVSGDERECGNLCERIEGVSVSVPDLISLVDLVCDWVSLTVCEFEFNVAQPGDTCFRRSTSARQANMPLTTIATTSRGGRHAPRSEHMFHRAREVELRYQQDEFDASRSWPKLKSMNSSQEPSST